MPAQESRSAVSPPDPHAAHRPSRADAGPGEDRLLWHFDAGAPVLETPAVLGGRAFFSDGDGTIRALETDTGDQLWQAASDGPAAVACVRTGRGPVLFAAGNRRLEALDAGTGSRLWMRTVRVEGRAARLTRPAWDGERLYVGCHFHGAVLALDPGSGETLARSEPVGEWPAAAPAVIRGGAGDGVYVAARAPEEAGGVVARLGRPALETRWRLRVPASGEAPSAPASPPVPLWGGSALCWSVTDGRVMAAETGRTPLGSADGAPPVAWSRRLRCRAEACLPAGPTVGPDGMIYAAVDAAGSDFGISAPCLYALDPASGGEVAWLTRLDGDPFRSVPLVTRSGTVFVRDGSGRVRAVRGPGRGAAGDGRGRVSSRVVHAGPAGSGGAPALAGDGGILLVGDREGSLRALDVSDLAGGGCADSPWPEDRGDAGNTACLEV